MITKLFAVYDSKAGAYMAPFSMQSAGQAARAFGDTVNDPKTTLNRHPADFTLFEIGSFDDTTGVVEAHNPINLGSALSFVIERPAPLFEEKEDS